MYEIVAIVLLAAFVVGITLAARRAREVFRIDVRAGKVDRVRGTVRQPTVQELTDVLSLARVDEAVIRGVRDRGRTRLEVRGVEPPVAQRLRNTFDAAS